MCDCTRYQTVCARKGGPLVSCPRARVSVHHARPLNTIALNLTYTPLCNYSFRLFLPMPHPKMRQPLRPTTCLTRALMTRLINFLPLINERRNFCSFLKLGRKKLHCGTVMLFCKNSQVFVGQKKAIVGGIFDCENTAGWKWVWHFTFARL